MKRLRWTVLVLLSLPSGLLSGCLDRPVYLEPGQIAEVRRDTPVPVWVVNKGTGKREARTVTARTGWYVGKPK